MSPFRAFVERLRKRRKSFLRLLMLAVVNAIVFAAVTYRLANKQERLARDQSRLSGELAQRTAELETVSSEGALVEENSAAVSTFWSDTVKSRVPGLTEAWEEIDRLARETDVTKGRTSYDRDLLDVGLEQIKATMPVEGDYFDLVRFINQLERSERFFLVDEIRISQQQSDETTLRLGCSISFYLKSDVETTAGP